MRGSPSSALMFVLGACLASGCGTRCEESSDVRVLLEGAPATVSEVDQLKVTVLTPALFETTIALGSPLVLPSAVVLRPNAAPNQSQYVLDVRVVAMRGTVAVAEGSLDQATVLASGCNELRLQLLPISGQSPDLASTEDLAIAIDADVVDAASMHVPADMSSTDMAVCPSLPDEDGDGRGDACDVCAANPDAIIADNDSDGVPNICDPRPGINGTKRLFFEGFNAAPNVGGVRDLANEASCPELVAGSYFAVANYNLPILAQAVFVPQSYSGTKAQAETRLYAPTATGSAPAGYACALTYDSTKDAYTLSVVLGTIFSDPNGGGGTTRVLSNLTANTFGPVGTAVRMRMLITANNISCEVASLDGAGPQSTNIGLGTITPPVAVGASGCWASSKVRSLYAAAQ